MVKRYIIKGIGFVFLFFVCAVPVRASSFVMPLEGLTFVTPVTFTKEPIINQQGLNVQINDSPQLSVKKVLTPDLLADIVITPIPTAIPRPTEKLGPPIPSPTEILETPIPTPTVSPTLSPTPSSLPQITAAGLNADTLFNMVNSYRTSNNLPAFQKNDQVCRLAETRAPAVDQEVATNTMHQGLKSLNLPYWNTENIISMNSETAAFNWWLNDPIHKKAIVGNFTYSCMACSGNSCAEEFTNLVKK